MGGRKGSVELLHRHEALSDLHASFFSERTLVGGWVEEEEVEEKVEE